MVPRLGNIPVSIVGRFRSNQLLWLDTARALRHAFRTRVLDELLSVDESFPHGYVAPVAEAIGKFCHVETTFKGHRIPGSSRLPGSRPDLVPYAFAQGDPGSF